MMNDDLRAWINEWRLGYIATVGAEGPNVSPKGTFQAVDEKTLIFAEIRSPNTMRNLGADNRVEVNMIDVFARKGARFRGTATFHKKASDRAAELAPRWIGLFGEDLMVRSSGFVEIALTSCKPLTTPAYDVGATEVQLRQDYLARFTAMQDAWLSQNNT
ncbi:MAG: pyridoxamine 5'-phosphate oxidase family protein [Pseudomonadota bacterium]